MRKRLVILLAATVALSSGVFLLFQVQGRSIEYHKQAYLDVQNGTGALNRIQRAVNRAIGKRVFSGQIQPEKIQAHEKALIELGYLEERECLVTNRSPHALVMPVYRAGREDLNVDFVRLGTRGTNLVIVVAPREDATKWERMVCEADTGSHESSP